METWRDGKFTRVKSISIKDYAPLFLFAYVAGVGLALMSFFAELFFVKKIKKTAIVNDLENIRKIFQWEMLLFCGSTKLMEKMIKIQKWNDNHVNQKKDRVW